MVEESNLEDLSRNQKRRLVLEIAIEYCEENNWKEFTASEFYRAKNLGALGIRPNDVGRYLREYCGERGLFERNRSAKDYYLYSPQKDKILQKMGQI